MATTLASLLPEDPVWKEVQSRLIILSDGMMSFFARNACEIAQHVTIDDATGTAADGLLFNQENVPTETLFYASVHSAGDRSGKNAWSAEAALKTFIERVECLKAFQFGGDASTGLGYCTVVDAHLRARGVLDARPQGPMAADILDLATEDSRKLQSATAEALAYLAYLKRFARRAE